MGGNMMSSPLFLRGRALLGSGLGRRCGLGDSARLGRAEDLGLLNYRRSLNGKEGQSVINQPECGGEHIAVVLHEP